MSAKSGHKQRSDRREVVAVDLFCGAGGLTRGLREAGISVVAGYDIDETCRHAYEHNNRGTIFIKKSVADLTKVELAAHYSKASIRVLVGCAPCQPFSRYTQGLDKQGDAKWGLLHEFGRLVRELQPEIVSMENVPELQRHQVFRDFLMSLTASGYHFGTDKAKRVVYCPDYGMPQHRKRLVLVASRLGPIEIVAPTCKRDGYVTVADALKKLPQIGAGAIDANDPLHRSSGLSALNRKRIRHSTPGGTWRDWPADLMAKCHTEETGKSYPSVYGRMQWDKPSPTITTQFYGYGNGRFGHPEQSRGLSLREGAILQTFPVDYEFVPPDSEYSFKAIGRMIGNAVPVRLGEVIGNTIVHHLAQY